MTHVATYPPPEGCAVVAQVPDAEKHGLPSDTLVRCCRTAAHGSDGHTGFVGNIRVTWDVIA